MSLYKEIVKGKEKIALVGLGYVECQLQLLLQKKLKWLDMI